MSDAGLHEAPEPPMDALLCQQCWSDVEAGWRVCRKCGEKRPPEGWTGLPFVHKGRYELVRRIARGGMGAVFEARDLHSGNRVAIKLAQGGPTAVEIVNAFEHEMELAGFLSKSPHFVTVHGWDGRPPADLVMEYVEWPTLGQHFRRDRFPLDPLDAARLGIGVCRGLELLRDHNLVHRDLKPDNLFVQPAEPEWRVKIADLGGWQSATDPDRSTITGNRGIQFLVGTPRYMSPEQMYSGPLTITSDIHSLASILWLCVVGDVPYPFRGAFNAQNREAINERYRRMQTVPPRPPALPEGLYLLLAGCLDIEPNNRPTARKLRQGLESFVRTLPGSHHQQMTKARQLSVRLEQARSILQDATDLHKELADVDEAWFRDEVHALDAKLEELRSELLPEGLAPSLQAAVSEHWDRTVAEVPQNAVQVPPPRSRLLVATVTAGLTGLLLGLWGPLFWQRTQVEVQVDPLGSVVEKQVTKGNKIRWEGLPTGEPVHLAPGEHVLRATHPNFREEKRLVEIPRRGSAFVQFQLSVDSDLDWRPTEELRRVQLPEQRAHLQEIREAVARCTGAADTTGTATIFLDGDGIAVGLMTENLPPGPVMENCVRRVAASVRAKGAGPGAYSVLSVDMGAYHVPSDAGPMGYELAHVRTVNGWGMGGGFGVPRHLVTLTPFALGLTEVTQGLWKRVTGEPPPLDCAEDPDAMRGDDLPVVCVSWDRAVRFANELSRKEGLDPAYQLQLDGTVDWVDGANGYRLPTEAEWEFGARGAEGPPLYAGADGLTCMVANLAPGRGCVDGVALLAPVGTYRANSQGLYDMTGNVAEWVWDRYGPVNKRPATNPQGPRRGRSRMVRGGDYLEQFSDRVVDRSELAPDSVLPTVGFRLARDKLR